MHYYIWIDENEYGPYSVDEMRQWLKEGRITSQVYARKQQDVNWRILYQIPELSRLAQNVAAIKSTTENSVTRHGSDNRNRQNTTLIEETTKKSRTKIIYISIFLSLALGGVSYFLIDRSQKQIAQTIEATNKAQFLEEEIYRKQLLGVVYSLALGADIADKTCQNHLSLWSLSIENRGNADDWIAKSLDEQSNTIASLIEGKKTLEKELANLKNPPEKLYIAHKKLITVYSLYVIWVEYASSPSGSFLSYREKLEQIKTDFIRDFTELKALAM